ncbi:MAG: virulence RhuM family protein [Bacteroidales bacterium]|nr:virulence RhuM family protein [Bacteroidales bacterium]
MAKKELVNPAMGILFNRDKKTIGKHINTALREELSGVPTVAKFATLQREGTRWVNRVKEFYNLDMILSVGYRVGLLHQR